MSPSASPLRAWLAADEPVVLDGALATELENRGCDLRDPLWSARILIERPELIRAVHADYFAAGADVAITASYQASFEGFARRGIGAEEANALLRRSVELAAAARDAFWAEPRNRVGRRRPLVAASVGPYGAMLADGSEYRGHYGLARPALMDFHRPRMGALLAAGADLLACETIPCLDEALALAQLLAEFPGAEAWIAFSCRDDAHVCQGERFDDCLRALDGFGQVAAVGLNCTAPAHVVPLLTAGRAATAKPLLAYPNSGERYDPGGKCWHGAADARQFAAAARGWYAAGARLIGGCCRTGPAEIAAIAAWARAAAA